MHGFPWITTFRSRVRRFANDFHEWRSHSWKSLSNRLTSGTKIVFHGDEFIVLFLARYFMSWTHNATKNDYRSLISPLALRTVFLDLALWPHHSWSVTSCERGYWHYDVMFVDFSFTRKLAQRLSWLVNSTHEYRFLITRYSRLCVWKSILYLYCIQISLYNDDNECNVQTNKYDLRAIM